MTIEDLAVMVKKGFDQTATKQDIADVRKEAADFRKEVLEQFELIHEDIKDIKNTLIPLVQIVAALEQEIRDLKLRLERLERKTGTAR